MSKPIDQERDPFELAYSCAVENGWESTKELARYMWDQARAAVQPAGVVVPDLNKTREQWKKVDARFCANNNSPAANMHLIEDAQRDIERLHRALAVPHPVSGEQDAIHQWQSLTGWIDTDEKGAADARCEGYKTRILYEAPPAAQDVLELRLCEQKHTVLKPGVVYLFTVDRNCAACVELDSAHRAQQGEQPS